MRLHVTPLGLFALMFALGAIVRGEEARRIPENLPAYAPARDTLVYVGTYTEKTASKGIYVFQLQTQNDEVAQNILLVPMGVAAETPNPSFLELDPKRRLVFVANELDSFNGQRTGAVSAFAVEATTGKLKLINQRASMGAGPCHVTLDRNGKFLFVANYAGGTVAVFPVAADGAIGEPTSVIQHTGKSVNAARQSEPHPHCVALDPSNKFAFVCDLGLDKVMMYRFDAATGKLTPAETPFATVKPGAGPRHLAFRPDGKFAYVVNELDSTVTIFAYDAAAGKLTEVATVSSVPPYFDGKNSGAEISVLPSGKFLFVSNRGANSVVLFAIDPAKGTLDFVEDQGTGGKTPRHFGVQPGAKHLAIANQNSNTVLVCRIDPDNGRLKPSGVFAEVPAPVCVQFLPPPGETKR